MIENFWYQKLRSMVLATLMLLMVSGIGLAQDEESSSEKEEDKTVTIADQIKEAKAEHRAMVRKMTTRMRKAESAEDRETIISERRAAELEITNRVIELTEESDDDELDIKILSWLAQYSKGKARQAVADTLLKDHIESEDLTQLVKSMSRSKTPDAGVEKILRTLIEKSPAEDVQGLATFNLAMHFQKLADAPKARRTRWAKSMSDAEAEYLENWDAEKAQAECEELLAKCVADFKDVKFDRRSTLGMHASTILARSNLKVGRTAPDIVGKDLDDVEFKLSDYRGKVVMVDFWGDW